MVIFHSHVKLPEGTIRFNKTYFWTTNLTDDVPFLVSLNCPKKCEEKGTFGTAGHCLDLTLLIGLVSLDSEICPKFHPVNPRFRKGLTLVTV